MIKKTLRFTDWDGNETEETWYFHISKADLLDMFADDEDISDKLKTVVESGDNRRILNAFKDILRMAVGRREGNRFVKTPEVADDFEGSLGYDDFLWDLVTNESESAQFVNNLFPKDLMNEIQQEQS